MEIDKKKLPEEELGDANNLDWKVHKIYINFGMFVFVKKIYYLLMLFLLKELMDKEIYLNID
jgi:hypothetical protein